MGLIINQKKKQNNIGVNSRPSEDEWEWIQINNEPRIDRWNTGRYSELNKITKSKMVEHILREPTTKINFFYLHITLKGRTYERTKYAIL